MPRQVPQPQTDDCFFCRPGDRATLLRALTGTDDEDRAAAAEHARQHLPGYARENLVRQLVHDLKNTRNAVFRDAERALRALDVSALDGLQAGIDDLPWNRHCKRAWYVLKRIEAGLEE
jgi:hypothetical protein